MLFETKNNATVTNSFNLDKPTCDPNGAKCKHFTSLFMLSFLVDNIQVLHLDKNRVFKRGNRFRHAKPICR